MMVTKNRGKSGGRGQNPAWADESVAPAAEQAGFSISLFKRTFALPRLMPGQEEI